MSGHNAGAIRLQHYISTWNNRPKDNDIAFWSWFVSEFYATASKRKICLSAYKDNPATSSKINRFLQDGSSCAHCREISKCGYVISLKEMPLYFQNKFASFDEEKLHLGCSEEHVYENGNILLYFAEVVEETIQNDARTYRMDPLAILYAPNKKIISWQFCMRRSEYFVLRSIVFLQVSEIFQIAKAIRSGRACMQNTKETHKMYRTIEKLCWLAKLMDVDKLIELGPSAQHLLDTCSTYVQSMTGSTVSACKSGFPSHTTDHLAEGPKFKLVAPPEISDDMYREGSVQPPANSQLHNISGSSSADCHVAPFCPNISGPPSNQNRMLVQLRPSPTQLKTVVTVGGICAQKLQQYVSEWNSRPTDNNISFWRNFVAEYYAPDSKRRSCMSACKDQAIKSLQHSKEKSQCAVCKEVSEKGLEVSFEEMAETFQKKFQMGMKELLCFERGKESNLANGDVVIFFKNMNILSMGPTRSISYTGQLVVTFNNELKISQWNWCLCRYEEFVSRGVLAPKLTEILQVAKKYEESQGGNELGGNPHLKEKIMKMIFEFAESRTTQDCQSVGSMNSPQNKNNFIESRHKSNPTSHAMAVCGNPNSFKTLKRSVPNNILETDPHPGQCVTRRRLEVNTSNNDSNNNAPSNLAEEELRRQEHQRLDKLMDKILAAKCLKDLHALIR